jgi:acyl-CoA dehydrogenase
VARGAGLAGRLVAGRKRGGAGVLAVAGCVFVVPGIRRSLVTAGIFKAFRKALPSMSQTEKDALEAGTVWWEGELFGGKPDWNTLLAYPAPRLTPEEQRFLDVETSELCRLTRTGSAPRPRTCPSMVWRTSATRAFWA